MVNRRVSSPLVNNIGNRDGTELATIRQSSTSQRTEQFGVHISDISKSIVEPLMMDDDTRLMGDIPGESTWTINDELRLQAADALHVRTLEYHNNVHLKKRLQYKNERSKAASAPLPSGVVARIVHSFPVSDLAHEVDSSNFISTLSKTKNYLRDYTDSIAWINILDITILESLGEILDIHPICVNAFCDFRTHSNTTVTSSSMLMTYCYFITGQEIERVAIYTSLIKAYIYISANLIVTFETELLDHSSVLQINPAIISCPSSVPFSCSLVMARWDKFVSVLKSVGSFYILHEIITETLFMQDPVLEFISRSLFYFKKNLHTNLTHKQKVAFMRKLHVIDCTTSMLLTHFEGNLDALSTVTDAAQLVAKQLMQRLILRSDKCDGKSISIAAHDGHVHTVEDKNSKALYASINQGPYLQDIMDSYNFLCDCIRSERVNVNRLVDTLDRINELRANNASMILSLIATIFLPATFFTGVFGMNFTIDGGFTIDLVNRPYGPLVFYVLCIFVFIACTVFFVAKGWVDPSSSIFLRCFRMFAKTSSGDSFVLAYANMDENSRLNAFAVDAKRQEESNRLREAQINAVEETVRSSVCSRY